LAACLLGAGAYTYDPARLVVPLLATAMAACAWSAVRRRPALAALSALVLLAIVVPLIIFQTTTGAERLSRVSVFSSGAPLLRSAGLIAGNYLSHFSPAFLFWRGDAELRHSIPGFGELHLLEAPFFVAGVALMLWRRRPVDWFLLLWLLIAPLPAALTREAPHALRSITALPAPSLVSAIGFFGLWDWWKRRELRRACASPSGAPRVARRVRWLALALGCVAAASVLRLCHALFIVYPNNPVVAAHWQYGLKQALWQIGQRAPTDHAPAYIFVSSQIAWAPMLALTYQRVDPARFREEGLKALRPIYCLGPTDSPQDYYQRSPPGAWFVLVPGESMPVAPTAAVFYPSRAVRQPVALLLYRKS